jgi:hypothetical protein
MLPEDSTFRAATTCMAFSKNVKPIESAGWRRRRPFQLRGSRPLAKRPLSYSFFKRVSQPLSSVNGMIRRGNYVPAETVDINE